MSTYIMSTYEYLYYEYLMIEMLSCCKLYILMKERETLNETFYEIMLFVNKNI